jgi:tetratricopeptide (TPR) repeat protein
MSDTPAPASSFAARASFAVKTPLAVVVVAGTGWQAIRISVEFGRHFGSATAWLTLAAALPFLAMSATGALGLFRGDRSRCHWLWIAAALSLFRWPIPDLPTILDIHLAFPLQRLTNGLIMFLTLIVSCTPAMTPGAGLSHRRLRPALVVIGVLAILAGRLVGTIYIDHVASTIVNDGNDAFEAGRQEDALALWRQVRQDFPDTRAEGMAIFNTSYAYQQQKRWAEAIPLLKELLASDLNDTDPTRELMNPYQNYHHRACLGLVDCYEHLEDHRSALHYAKLARNVYPHRSWCLTCRIESNRALNRKIARLEIKVAGNEKPTSDH